MKVKDVLVLLDENDDVLPESICVGSEWSWKYYVHLNKLFSPMETSGLIENNGLKLGPTKKFEKVWVRSANNARKSNI